MTRVVPTFGPIPEMRCPRCGELAELYAFDGRQHWGCCVNAGVRWVIGESRRRTYVETGDEVDVSGLLAVPATSYRGR